ncbi:MAG: FAD-binding oxidoreductase [Planctomycetota bacterium]
MSDIPPAYATAGPELLRPTSPSAVAAELAAARVLGQKVIVTGNASRPGPAARAERVDRILSVNALLRVVAYEPDDLTITVQAGLDVLALDQLLAEHGQMLPVQRRAGSLGGLLSVGADSLTDAAYGRARHRVLGCTVALANGALASGRGRVVKNVAGYDLPRLMVGSLGTLGALVEVCLKLQPRPQAHASLIFDLATLQEAFDAAATVRASPHEPVCLDVLADTRSGDVARLAFGFDGSTERVKTQVADVEALLRSPHLLALDLIDGEPDDAWRAELDSPDGDVVLRIGCLPTRLPELAQRLLQLAREAGVHVRLDARPMGGVLLLMLDAAPTDVVRAMCTEARAVGHAVLLAAPPGLSDHADVWGPPPADLPLMRRVKTALDNDGVLAAGRFVGGL